MKKIIFSNLPIVVVLGFILYQIDYNSLRTLDYIYITLCTLAFAAMIFNLITTFIKEKKDV
ncbi:hypothetical protein [Bacillus sp. TL12]|uniref:hypothetical protein n=1 Tax=Bacillus sp. TL12 TaxID=2894756 RepID=UPI001F52A810|nr:hypothetical protein [Bacillus sp. TL12]MCI0767411.1 hypothetical protein [Bacillus sp. TL12]